MFQRVHQYELLEVDGRWYRPRAYGDPQPDGTWNGWIIFFPLVGGGAIAPPHAETMQSTWTALVTWASGLTPVYLEGAFDRALRLAEPPSVVLHLAAAEYEALQDAEQLEIAAKVARTAAKLDDTAADAARADAERLRRERLAAQRALAATEEAVATVEAHTHEQAARDARATAAQAGRRRRSAEEAAAAGTPGKTRARAKNKKK